jgi:hypothetical protein
MFPFVVKQKYQKTIPAAGGRYRLLFHHAHTSITKPIPDPLHECIELLLNPLYRVLFADYLNFSMRILSNHLITAHARYSCTIRSPYLNR